MVKPPDKRDSNNHNYNKQQKNHHNHHHQHYHHKQQQQQHHTNKHQQQHRKYHQYRTKWLKLCRCTYPGPYPGPGPGPGSLISLIANKSVATPVTTTACLSVEDAFPSTDPSSLSSSSSFATATKTTPTRMSTATATIKTKMAAAVSATQTASTILKNSIRFCCRKRRRHRHYQHHHHSQRSSFACNLMWLLIVLVWLDDGLLLINCKSTATTTKLAPTTTIKTITDRTNNISNNSKLSMNNINDKNASNNRFVINNKNTTNNYYNDNDKSNNNNNNNMFKRHHGTYMNNNYNNNKNKDNDSISVRNNKFSNKLNKEIDLSTTNNNKSENGRITFMKSRDENVFHQNDGAVFLSSQVSSKLTSRSSRLSDYLLKFNKNNKNNNNNHNNFNNNRKVAFAKNSTETINNNRNNKNNIEKNYSKLRPIFELITNKNFFINKTTPTTLTTEQLVVDGEEEDEENPNTRAVMIISVNKSDNINKLSEEFVSREQNNQLKNKRTINNNITVTNQNYGPFDQRIDYKNRRTDDVIDDDNADNTDDVYEKPDAAEQLLNDQFNKKASRHSSADYLYQKNRHHHHRYHHHHHQKQQQQLLVPSTESYESQNDRSLQLDENEKRSILASISCPNCVYNIESYISSSLFQSSTTTTTKTTSPTPSTPILTSVPSSMNKRYQQEQQHLHNSNYFHSINSNLNAPTHRSNQLKLTLHQHQVASDTLRLESIKHQILSKLGLKTKPNITQTLPKQFVMETLYRADSGGGGASIAAERRLNNIGDDGNTVTDRKTIIFKQNSQYFNQKYNENDDTNAQYSSDNINNVYYNNQNNENLMTMDDSIAISSSKMFDDDKVTRHSTRNGINEQQFRTASSSVSPSSTLTTIVLNSDDSVSDINLNSEQNHQQYRNKNQDIVDKQFIDSVTDQLAAASSSSASSSSTSSSEQDDFFGRTKEIITFAEKGDILNGHRLIEFTSPSDQVTGQDLRIRAASMWIRLDLRPFSVRNSRTSSRFQQTSFSSNLKVWVFRLIEPFATSRNLTEFAEKDFDQLTTLSTTLNVQLNQLGWQKLDITETVRHWYANDKHLRLRLLVDCSGCGDRVILHLFDSDRSTKNLHSSGSKAKQNGHHHHHFHSHGSHNGHHQKQQQKDQLHSPYNQYRHLQQQQQQQPRPHHRSSSSSTGGAGVSLPSQYANDRRRHPNQSNSNQHIYTNDSRTRASTMRYRATDHVENQSSTPSLSRDVNDGSYPVPPLSVKQIDPNRPFLVIHTEPNVMKRVRRRALDCSGALNGQCCKESFYVSFKALGWDDWIIAPHGYFANYCRGDCGGPHRTPDTFQSYHTHVMEEFRKMDRLNGMQPCCAPLKFSSMSLIYYGKEGIIKRDLPKMVVDECGCP